MADTDRDEAVEAAERAFVSASSPWPVDDKLWAKVKREMPNGTVHRRDILLVIEAIRPIIAAAVRAEVLAEAEAAIASVVYGDAFVRLVDVQAAVRALGEATG